MRQALWRAQETRWLAPILALGLAVSGFLKIADEVLEGEAHAWDSRILAWCRVAGQPDLPWGPLWFQEGMRDLTALGSPAVLAFAVLAAWGGLMLARQRGLAWLALGSAVGGQGLALALKAVFSRDRPDAVFHATVAAGHSFPSSHAMMSAVVFLTLAALLARLTPRTRLRLYVMGVAAVLSGAVGVSRVYLGVHWASDVAAGWAGGAAWALLCWQAAHWLGLGREDSGHSSGQDSRQETR
ncbi:MAG: phosphatase PAP2 family protein [Proteobacteria bacterium]|uniref:phosphatase PAP2 family protein n=1 Tax=Aquabacterium sp. TaxID=1872578 RepID=UPI0035C74B25|nr:phosphatase PAP2 family protein [Pseudomonadota bacterium]